MGRFVFFAAGGSNPCRSEKLRMGRKLLKKLDRREWFKINAIDYYFCKKVYNLN
jgi:hypothetical protein